MSCTATVARVRAALTALAAGEMVTLLDDVSGADEGDLIFAADHATPKLLAFTVRHTSGYVCVALPADECDRLKLPPMVVRESDQRDTAYRVSVDLIGTGTGISAVDRARTVAALASPESVAADFSRPGHVIPLRAKDGGVFGRQGRTEAAMDLARLSGRGPAGVLCEIVSTEQPGQMARRAEVESFACEHGLRMVSMSDLLAYRRYTEPQIERFATTTIPTVHGRFRAIGYRGLHDGAEHIALISGQVEGAADVPLYVHAECLTGDVLGSVGCDCHDALVSAQATIGEAGRGLIVYARHVDTPRACGLFESVDTAAREAAAEVAATILLDLGVESVTMLGADAKLQEILRGYDVGSSATPVGVRRREHRTPA